MAFFVCQLPEKTHLNIQSNKSGTYRDAVFLHSHRVLLVEFISIRKRLYIRISLKQHMQS